MTESGRKGRKKLERSREELASELLFRRVGAQERIEDVADDLGISASLAYRLVRKASNPLTVIPATVVATRRPEDDLRTKVEAYCRRFGVQHLEILSTPALDEPLLASLDYWYALRRSLGALAATYVEGLLDRGKLRSGAHVAVSGGRAAMSFSQYLLARAKPTKGRPGRAQHTAGLPQDLVFRPLTLVALTPIS